jgi:P-type Ca2+ transporter type 2C
VRSLRLDTMLKGLTTSEVEQLLKKYGQNTIEDRRKVHFLKKLFEQLANFLILLLVLAAGLSFFLGEVVDGVLILGIVILNAIFGLYQEQKAEEAVALLKTMTVTNIRVIRDGDEKEIDSKYLVPGDIILIDEGVKVPADAKIIEAINLEINESALTGESLPVVKASEEEIFMGTIVSKGRGKAQVSATGMQTKFGQIAAKLSSLEETKTPLQKKLESLSEVVGIVGILISVLIFGISVYQGYDYFPSFLFAVSLAVAIVPEGLPAVMTITLSVGVKDMAKKNAIVRKLAAIEALGSITLIATDKTGTLTMNKMNVKEVWVDKHLYDIDNLPHSSNHPFRRLIENGVLCSTASLVPVHDHGSFDVLGDPTEGALLYLAKKVETVPEKLREEWKILDEIPFDSLVKRMSVVVQKEDEIFTFTKGAPESILDTSSKIMIGTEAEELSDEKRKEIEQVMDKWTSKGLRVLGFSYSLGKNHASNQDQKHLKDQVFLGLVAIYDPPREEAKGAIAKAHEAGIKVVMITGDNEKTAEAIGTTVGLLQEGDVVITGEKVEAYSDQDLLAILPKVKIFARTTPFHKSRIVSLYQRLGEIVAVTGDGVNDAIALKQADVGVAMGKVGTDVARETADMVITDDNFATIVTAVEEGRNILKNLKNSIKYLFTGNLSEALTLLIGLLLGLPPLLIPIQILYINLISDGMPALALAFSPREKNSMKRGPEKKMQLLSWFDMSYIGSIGLITGLIVVSSYFIIGGDETARRTTVFVVLALIQTFIFTDVWLSHRPVHKHYRTFISKSFLAAFLLPFICQILIVQIPFLTKLFEVTATSLFTFGQYIIAATSVMIGIKLMKIVLGYEDREGENSL